MDFGCSVGIFRVPYKRRRNVNTKTCKKNVNRFWVLKENFCLNPIRYNTVAKKKLQKTAKLRKKKITTCEKGSRFQGKEYAQQIYLKSKDQKVLNNRRNQNLVEKSARMKENHLRTRFWQISFSWLKLEFPYGVLVYAFFITRCYVYIISCVLHPAVLQQDYSPGSCPR